MNKLAEKISPVMNDAELQQLVSDHYLGEAQLLTPGAEENLLKLKELRGVLTAGEAARWEQIKRDFLRNKAIRRTTRTSAGAWWRSWRTSRSDYRRSARPPVPEPVVRLPDELPDVIRPAVEPLIDAIRATQDAIRATHAQQSEAAEAMLRVVAAVRVVPTAAQPVVVAPAGEPLAIAVAGQPITVAAGGRRRRGRAGRRHW
ncbi:MAG TPA: hypothetical protein VHG93_23870 [Longimicrobium sp.]|nr:hypothetical protein [Longimicrobium sp.]